MKKYLINLAERYRDSFIGQGIYKAQDRWNVGPKRIVLAIILSIAPPFYIGGRVILFLRGEDGSFLDCLLAPFTSLICFAICITISVMLFIKICSFFFRFYREGYIDTYTGKIVSKKSVVHDATKEEAEENFHLGTIREIHEPILGVLKRPGMDEKIVGYIYGSNGNMFIFGSSGAGKNRDFINPAIEQAIRRSESIICIDPKGETYRFFAMVLRLHGYDVKYIDFRPGYSMTSDSSDMIGALVDKRTGEGNPALISLFSRAFINSVCDKTKDFWASAGDNALQGAIFAILSRRNTMYERNFKGLLQLMQKSADEFIAICQKMVREGETGRVPIDNIAGKGEKSREDAIHGVSDKLSMFSDTTLFNITGTKDMEFDGPAKRKSAYFIGLDVVDDSRIGITGMFMTLLINSLMEYAKRHSNGRLNRPIYFIMDELKAVGVIPKFSDIMATNRGYGFNMMCFMQSFPQLQEAYGEKGADAILDNCDIVATLKIAQSIDTAEWFMRRIGKARTKVESERYVRDRSEIMDMRNEVYLTEALDEFALWSTERLFNLPEDHLVIVPSSEPPIELEKFSFMSHPMTKELKRADPQNHLPKWVKNLTDEDVDRQNLIPLLKGTSYIDDTDTDQMYRASVEDYENPVEYTHLGPGHDWEEIKSIIRFPGTPMQDIDPLSIHYDAEDASYEQIIVPVSDGIEELKRVI